AVDLAGQPIVALRIHLDVLECLTGAIHRQRDRLTVVVFPGRRRCVGTGTAVTVLTLNGHRVGHAADDVTVIGCVDIAVQVHRAVTVHAPHASVIVHVGGRVVAAI